MHTLSTVVSTHSSTGLCSATHVKQAALKTTRVVTVSPPATAMSRSFPRASRKSIYGTKLRKNHPSAYHTYLPNRNLRHVVPRVRAFNDRRDRGATIVCRKPIYRVHPAERLTAKSKTTGALFGRQKRVRTFPVAFSVDPNDATLTIRPSSIFAALRTKTPSS